MLEDGDKPEVETIFLPCGGTASFCYEAGYGYRCEDCGAVVNSIAMPRECVEEKDKYEVVLPSLGSKVKWDYEIGEETLNEKAKQF